MFGEKRKYFDYELAYEGYLKAKELFDKGGVEELKVKKILKVLKKCGEKKQYFIILMNFLKYGKKLVL